MLGGWVLVLIHDDYKGKNFLDLGGKITIPMNVITRENVLSYLRVFGKQEWKKVNFKNFSRINSHFNKSCDFCLENCYWRQKDEELFEINIDPHLIRGSIIPQLILLSLYN